MTFEPSPEDRKKILKLSILTQELALLQEKAQNWRTMQRTLIIDLVQREVLSQARASRIAEVGRDTIRIWVNVHPADVVSAKEEADLLVAADRFPTVGEPLELHPDWGKPSDLPPGHGA